MKLVNNPTEILGEKVIQDNREILESLIKGIPCCKFEWGNSLYPIIRDGEYVRILPINLNNNFALDRIKVGDVVFCEFATADGEPFYMIHMVTAISYAHYSNKPWFKIGSTHGETYGWTQKIYGLCYGTDYIQQKEKKKSKYWF